MINLITTILKRKKYTYIAIVFSILMSGVSYYLTVMDVYQKSIQRYVVLNGLWFTIFSLLFSFIISLMFGVYIALFIFKRDIGKNKALKSGATTGVGSALVLATTGCPTCGIPLLGLLGVPFGLTVLPLKGIEIKLIGVGLLYLSLYLILKSIRKGLNCSVDNK